MDENSDVECEAAFDEVVQVKHNIPAHAKTFVKHFDLQFGICKGTYFVERHAKTVSLIFSSTFLAYSQTS